MPAQAVDSGHTKPDGLPLVFSSKTSDEHARSETRHKSDNAVYYLSLMNGLSRKVFRVLVCNAPTKTLPQVKKK